MLALRSESVANFFINKSLNDGLSLSMVKLVKLVYISHGWHLGYLGKSLISDAVQAWQYGVMIPKLYRSINDLISNPARIDSLIEGYGIIDDGMIVNTPPDEETVKLLNKVWKSYSKLSGVQLSTITNKAGTPWEKSWSATTSTPYSGLNIANNLIQEYYESKIT